MPVNFIKKYLQPKDSGTQYRTILQLLHLDFPLLISVFLLLIVGLFILYSASNQQMSIVFQEILHAGFALILMFVLAQIPPHWYERWAPILFSVAILFLVIVLIVGRIDKGAQRWLNLGLFHFEPSAFMQIVLPMMLAWYFSHRSLPPTFKELIVVGLMIIVPALLTAKEPDLGSAIMITLIGLSMLFLAGVRWRYIFGVFALVIVSMPIVWHMLHRYQKQRILTFLNPQRDPLGAGYHIIQSKIAIGSGGFFGKGWLQGTQSHLHFLPEHATDFIFAVTGEELGLLGACFLLLIYLGITLRCFYIARKAQNTYARLLAGGLSMMFFFSFFINIGMVMGILPVVGLPLPLISYGGSSMVSLMAAFGILMSINGHKRLLSK